MHLLNNFDDLEVIRQINNSGWEPLDVYSSGDLSVERLRKLLGYIYQPKRMNIDKLNKFYMQSGRLPLTGFDTSKSVGLKMRLVPHKYIYPSTQTRFARWNKYWYEKLQENYPERFREAIFDQLVKNKVEVFFTVRQDLLRWALSKYHGDGTGKDGHMQFRLANGEMSRDEIQRIEIDCDRLETLIQECEAVHEDYKSLRVELNKRGINCHILRYEDFLEDKLAYFEKFGIALGYQWDAKTITNAIEAGAFFKKVHGTDISSFIVNHEEVIERFGHCFYNWA